jgi:heme/copper-type cytochrome/quinol oxidase subunit 2
LRPIWQSFYALLVNGNTQWSMNRQTDIKTEEDIAPNFWKWMLVALCLVVLVALAVTGIFYYFRGKNENRQPPGVPQSMVWEEGIELSENVGEHSPEMAKALCVFAS